MNAQSISRALGSHRNGNGFLCRCPVPSHGRGKGDRNPSLSVADGNDGKLLFKCFAGCDPRDVLDELRRRGLLDGAEHIPQNENEGLKLRGMARPPRSGSDARTDAALMMWRRARDPRGTLAEIYLSGRGLELPDDGAEVIRFHPDCSFGTGQPRLPCMIALVRNIVSNVPQAIHRTALNRDGSAVKNAAGKTARLSFGPIRGGAIDHRQ